MAMGKETTSLHAALAPLLAALLGCTSPYRSPFPDLGPLSHAEMIEVLRARTAPRALYAELVVSFQGPELEGIFDAVACFRAPGHMRLVAFKDIVLTTESIFDLALTPTAYGITIADRKGEAPTIDRGRSEAFAGRHPQFAGFFWTREAFCLPGATAAEAALVSMRDDGPDVRVETPLLSGASVVWLLDRRTLEVRSGVVESPDGHTYSIEYFEYRLADGFFVPGRVVFTDPASSIRIEARVDTLEVNPDLEDELFDPRTVGA